ncbi:MAG: alpha/beta hydrolase [Dehalococcoidia bacterium]
MDVQQLVDPEVARVIAPLVGNLDGVGIEDIPRVRAERAAAMPRPVLSDAVERTDVTVPGPAGAPDVRVRLHRPKARGGEALPAVFWMHGGGYIFGTYEGDDLRFDGWVRELHCVGASVEYRLAPEHPHPAAVEDSYAALKWLHEHASELGVDAGRIGIGGASAGAGLAAGLALYARDRGEVPVAFQLLIYPMLDDRQATPSSGWPVPIWAPSHNTLGWRAYLGERYGSDDVPIYAAPARATDLEGLPPTLIAVGTLDGFVDEDLEYARRLNHAGVPVELHMYPGAPHGFDSMAPDTAVARRARTHMEDWLARQLRP